MAACSCEVSVSGSALKPSQWAHIQPTSRRLLVAWLIQCRTVRASGTEARACRYRLKLACVMERGYMVLSELGVTFSFGLYYPADITKLLSLPLKDVPSATEPTRIRAKLALLLGEAQTQVVCFCCSFFKPGVFPPFLQRPLNEG